MMFLVYLTMLLGPIATLTGSAVQFQNNLAGLDRVLDLLAAPRELESVKDRSECCEGMFRESSLLRGYPFNTQNPTIEYLMISRLKPHLGQRWQS